MSKRYTLELEKPEVELVLRALTEMRERGKINIAQNDVVVNLVDYIEAETQVKL